VKEAYASMMPKTETML